MYRPGDELSDPGSFRIGRAEQREVLQNGHAVNERVADPLGRFGIFLRDVADRFGQVRDGLRREDYFAAHEATSLRASSSGTPLPASTSRMASSRERRRRCSSLAVIAGTVRDSSQSERALFSSWPSLVMASWISASVLMAAT